MRGKLRRLPLGRPAPPARALRPVGARSRDASSRRAFARRQARRTHRGGRRRPARMTEVRGRRQLGATSRDACHRRAIARRQARRDAPGPARRPQRPPGGDVRPPAGVAMGAARADAATLCRAGVAAGIGCGLRLRRCGARALPPAGRLCAPRAGRRRLAQTAASCAYPPVTPPSNTLLPPATRPAPSAAPPARAGRRRGPPSAAPASDRAHPLRRRLRAGPGRGRRNRRGPVSAPAAWSARDPHRRHQRRARDIRCSTAPTSRTSGGRMTR